MRWIATRGSAGRPRISLAGLTFFAVVLGALGVRADSPEIINDCPQDHCPSLVVVPASPPGFEIGSPADEAERVPSEAQHKVAIKSFAIGSFAVRTSEYMACVAAKGCPPPEWAEPGNDNNIETGTGVTYKSMGAYVTGANQPIVGVSWDDANAYAAWLSKKTGHRYRLPSEAEWEYAARAGSKTRFWWGDEPKLNGKVMACCRGCGSGLDGDGPYPVDQFAPNPFGLFNVHGNVWEWVEDYFCESYAGGPSDGSARQSKSCGAADTDAVEGLRVFRGGSCYYEPRQMRSAMRLRNWPSFRNQTVGFRIARNLKP